MIFGDFSMRCMSRVCFGWHDRMYKKHAKTLGFIHPKSNKKISFDSEIPDDMNSVINKWRLYSKHKNL